MSISGQCRKLTQIATPYNEVTVLMLLKNQLGQVGKRRNVLPFVCQPHCAPNEITLHWNNSAGT